MQNKTNLEYWSNKSIFSLDRNHWNYPFETIYMNKQVYFKKAKQSINAENATREFFDNRGEDGKNEELKFAVLELIIDSFKLTKSESKALMMGHYKTVASFKETEQDYKAFLHKSITTIDIYGLGISFRTVYYGCKHLLSSQNRQLLLEICNS